jgi:hypothetical protein
MYIVDTQAVQVTANNFVGFDKARNRYALSRLDGSAMVVGMGAGAYDYKTACRRALFLLRLELKQRGKI